VTQRFLGHVDAIEPALAGWVIDARRPGTPVRFAVMIDRSLRLAAVADLPRPDVAAAGMGGADCGFRLDLPAHLFDGAPHDMRLVLANGRKLDLPGLHSPVVLGPVSAKIVPLTAADLDAVADLLRETHRESGLEPDAVSDRYVAGWIASNTDAGGALIGAWVGRRLAGYALLEPSRDPAAPIGAAALSVLRQYRRKGLGERLVRALLAAVRASGQIAEVWLAVAPRNLPARRLYEKLSFTYCAAPPPSLFVPVGYLTMLCRTDSTAR